MWGRGCRSNFLMFLLQEIIIEKNPLERNFFVKGFKWYLVFKYLSQNISTKISQTLGYTWRRANDSFLEISRIKYIESEINTFALEVAEAVKDIAERCIDKIMPLEIKDLTVRRSKELLPNSATGGI